MKKAVYVLTGVEGGQAVKTGKTPISAIEKKN